MTAGIIRTQAPARQLDALELLAAGYLLLPVFVFVLGWLKLPYALPLAATLLPACYLVWRQRHSGAVRLSRAEWSAAILASIAWVSLSGLTDGLYLNKDWLVRMSVLRDLVVGSWPASYGQQDGGDLILRCPLGYYVVPALVGKLTSLAGARIMLWLWTAIGAALFLALVLGANPERKTGHWKAALLIAIGFSGMDILGWLLAHQKWVEIGQHIEWWAGWWQLSSHTTQLFWVPNHALPGWLVAVIAWRHRRHGLAAMPAALVLLGVIFWAPLVAVGALPLLLWCVWRQQGVRGIARESLSLPLWALLPVTLLTWRFLTMNVQAVGAAEADPRHVVAELLIFSFLEWGFLTWVVVHKGKQHALLVIAVIEFLLLPWTAYGPGNDLMMRGSIPALAILMLCTIEAWHNAQPLRRTALALLLLAGSVTPLLEFQRALQPGERYLHAQQDFVQVNGKPWHYVAPLTRPEIVTLLKQPQPMAPAQP